MSTPKDEWLDEVFVKSKVLRPVAIDAMEATRLLSSIDLEGRIDKHFKTLQAHINKDYIKRSEVEEMIPEKKPSPLPENAPLMTKKWEGYNQAIADMKANLEQLTGEEE